MSNIIRTSDFAAQSALYIVAGINKVLLSCKDCVVCLAGGNTPLPIYENLALMKDLAWERVYIAFGDERNVPPSNDQSNYKSALDALLSKVPIPQSNIFRIEAENGLPNAAEDYGETLLGLKTSLGRDYIFDIMLLGIGNDGHTASLFPGTKALEVTDKLVSVNEVPQLNTERITLTYTAISEAKEIIFLVNDPSKNKIMEKIWNNEDLPATKVNQLGDRVTWIVGE